MAQAKARADLATAEVQRVALLLNAARHRLATLTDAVADPV